MTPLVGRQAGRWTVVAGLAIVAALVLGAGTAPAGPRKGSAGELTVADATAPPPSLDPFKVYGTQAQSLFRLIYEPLFDRDPDGRIITPLLERWGRKDARTWEFQLRPGLRFHDGGELEAADVVFSLRRILDPQVGSPRRHDFAELEEVVAVDRLTVRIVTRRPYALLPARLSQFSMILPDQLRGRPEAEFFQRPIGLGPFQLAELGADRTTLAAFPGYYAGPPPMGRVVFRFIPDSQHRVRALLDGTVDLVTNVLPHQVDTVIQARGVRLVKRNSIRFMDVFIDARRGPLAQADVRRALRHGTDVEGLIRYVARGNGRAIPTVTLPEDFGYEPGLKPYPLDPPKARALLARAGHAGGFRLRGLATHDTETVATAVAQQWAKLGVTLDIAVESRATSMSRWMRERDQHDFLFLDPTSIVFDAAFQLRVHLDPAHPMARSPHAGGLDLLNEADAEPETGTRANLLKSVQGLVYQEALVIPLYQVVDLYGLRDGVRDFVPAADTMLRLGRVRLVR